MADHITNKVRQFVRILSISTDTQTRVTIAKKDNKETPASAAKVK